MIIAIDPSVRATGIAHFVNGAFLSARVLVNQGDVREACTLVREHLARYASLVDALVIEVPRVYTGAKSTGDANDLISISLVAGAAIGAVQASCAVHLRHPHQWKGQQPKGVVSARSRESLDENERDIFDALTRAYGAKAHNAFDAVGIGLHHLGRLTR